MANWEPPESFRRWITNYPSYASNASYPVYPPPPVVAAPEPLSDALRLNGQQKAVYEIDKRTHRVRFEDEDENFVRVVIEPKDSPA